MNKTGTAPLGVRGFKGANVTEGEWACFRGAFLGGRHAGFSMSVKMHGEASSVGFTWDSLDRSL